jgi:hypothetical protein
MLNWNLLIIFLDVCCTKLQARHAIKEKNNQAHKRPASVVLTTPGSKEIKRMNTKLKSVGRGLLILLAILIFLHAGPQAIGQPIPTNAYPPLDTWSFNNTNTWVTDLGYAPVSFTNLTGSYLGQGTSLVVDSTNDAWLQYNVVENDGTTTLTVDQGSVLLWFAPDWSSTNQGGTGPGDAGRLIEVGSYTADASYGWWSIYIDPEGENIYFSAQTNDGTGIMYFSAPISWTTNNFHQIAVTYSSTNSSLFMDGAFVTNGPGVTIYPGPDVLTNGFWIGSDSNGVIQAHGIFDNISTYTNQLDSTAISEDYTLSWVFYAQPAVAGGIIQAPSNPETIPTFDAVTGLGYLVAVSTNETGCTNSSNVWITNATTSVATNGGVNFTFTIEGGTNGLAYDVFATTALTMPLTNGVWTWMGQGNQCVTYTIPNLTNSPVFLLLGTPQDSDGDGLTDAYELLVSHTNPYNSDTSGDGMLDGWKVLWGMNPMINNSALANERANYVYDGTGRLETLSGFLAEQFLFDAEGSITTDQP